MMPILTTPLALIALVSLPVLAGIYLLRNRARRVTVSSLVLWRFDRQPRQGGRKINRLTAPWLFLLELLILVLLVLAATTPMMRMKNQVRRLVVVLDNSFSMHASNGKTTAKERAVDALRREMKNADTRAYLVLAGPAPVLLGEGGLDRQEVERLLSQWNCTSASADLRAAMALGQSVAGSRAECLVLTDEMPDSASVGGKTVWHAVGQPLPNIAFTAATRSADRCLLEVSNFSSDATQTELIISQDGQASAHSLQLSPGETRRLVFQLAVGAGDFEAVLEADALTADNQVVLLPEAQPRVRVAVRVANERLRDAIIQALEASGRYRSAAGDAELVFTDSDGGTLNNPDLWSVRFLSDDTPQAYLGPFLIDSSHPVTDGLSLEDVIWTAGEKASPAGKPIALAGNRALIAVRQQGMVHDLEIALTPRHTTLFSSPDWPILLWNILDWRAAMRPGLRERNLTLGKGTLFRTSSSSAPDEVLLDVPGDGKQHVPVANQTAVITPTTSGIYRVHDAENSWKLAVNPISPAESDLRGAGSGRTGTWLTQEVLELQYSSVSWMLLLAALAVLCLHHLLLIKKRAGDPGGGG